LRAVFIVTPSIEEKRLIRPQYQIAVDDDPEGEGENSENRAFPGRLQPIDGDFGFTWFDAAGSTCTALHR